MIKDMDAPSCCAEMTARIGKHAEEIKLSGAEYCDCPACAAGLEILNHKEVIL